MTYLDILNDKEILTIYDRIDVSKQYEPRYYGLTHISNTVEYAKKLAKCFDLTERETDQLMIACVLHNLGHLNGKNLHAQTGSEMAKTYLKKNKFATEDIVTISNAIANHIGKATADYYNNVSACLILADKMDITATRYKPYFEDITEDDKTLKSITYMDVTRVGNVVQLTAGGTGVDWNRFVATTDYAKLYICFERVCKKRKLKFVFKKRDLE